MSGDRERRSSLARAHALVDQVGGRQAGIAVPAGGGGYQGSRSTATSHLAPQNSRDRDARIVELEKMGLSRALISVAEAIGYDNFIAMWRILDQEQAYRTEKGDLEVPMRAFRSYLRFQRNRVIEALVAEGRSVNEIRQHLKDLLCETVTPRHIRRLRSGR